MLTEIRTAKGKLIGKIDETAGTLNIKNGHMLTLIKIPLNGMVLFIDPGDGITEEVHISQY
jgi:sporulation protein YlmC with PRC-barrel domain